MTTGATIGTGSALSLAGKVDAEATQTATVITTASGDAKALRQAHEEWDQDQNGDSKSNAAPGLVPEHTGAGIRS